MSRRTGIMVALMLVFVLSALLYMCTWPAWYYFKSDDITRAEIDTARILHAYERSHDPAPIRAWIAESIRSDGAPGCQVMMTLAAWSCRHQRGFLDIVDGLGAGTKKDFVLLFPSAVAQAGDLDVEFKDAFRSYRSPMLDKIRVYLH